MTWTVIKYHEITSWKLSSTGVVLVWKPVICFGLPAMPVTLVEEQSKAIQNIYVCIYIYIYSYTILYVCILYIYKLYIYIYIYTKTIPNQTSKSYWNVLGSLHPLPDQLEQPLSTRSYPHGISRSLTALSKLVSTARFLGSYPVISRHIESYRDMFILSILSYWCTVGTLKYTQILDSSELKIFRMWFHAFPQFASPHRLLSAILVAWPVPRCTRGSGFYPE